jgi:hypothetical protein
MQTEKEIAKSLVEWMKEELHALCDYDTKDIESAIALTIKNQRREAVEGLRMHFALQIESKPIDVIFSEYREENAL